jgi:hypothetical protein
MIYIFTSKFIAKIHNKQEFHLKQADAGRNMDFEGEVHEYETCIVLLIYSFNQALASPSVLKY